MSELETVEETNTDQKTKKASLFTLGCRLNQGETKIIQDQMKQRGFEVVPFGEKADLAVINTCTVTNLADAKSRNIIRQFIRKNPEAITAVVGCYSQTGYKDLAEIKGVDWIIGNQDKLNVLDYIGDEKNESPVVIRDRINKQDFSVQTFGDLPFNQRANLKIQDGCSFVCTFCIIPTARGGARSRDFNNLLEEAHELASRGVREVVITGVNIGTYDNSDKDVLGVVDALNEINGIDRIRISSIEPTTIPWELFDRMNDPEHALLPFFHIPLQSGCDRILKLMRRKYTLQEYLDFVNKAYNYVDGLYLGTDIMIGFPGETEAEFEETCQTFINNPFGFCHVFSYSERHNTPATKMEGSVPIPERQKRSSKLRAISSRKRQEYYRAHLGKEMRVLFENPKENTFPGYTDNYIRVVVPKGEENLANRTGIVQLETLGLDFVEGRILKMLD